MSLFQEMTALPIPDDHMERLDPNPNPVAGWDVDYLGRKAEVFCFGQALNDSTLKLIRLKGSDNFKWVADRRFHLSEKSANAASKTIQSDNEKRLAQQRGGGKND